MNICSVCYLRFQANVCVCVCVCVCTRTYVDFPFRPVVVRTVYELDIIVVETEGTEYCEVEAEDITQHRQ